MPVNPTFPGVYIEEIPSGVRTITGVSTSVTAFLGKAERGPANKAVHTLSFQDYERSFGGLSSDSEMSYAVSQFFLNGGTEAWVVRLAKNAVAAEVVLQDDSSTSKKDVLRITARDEGPSGNDIQIQVQNGTAAKTFNLIFNYAPQGRPADNRTEAFKGLSMDKTSSHFVEDMINDTSQLVTVKVTQPPTAGTLTSGTITDNNLASLKDDQENTFQISFNKADFTEISIGKGKAQGADLPAQLANIATRIQDAVRTKKPSLPAWKDFTCAVSDSKLVLTSGVKGSTSSVTVKDAGVQGNNIAGALHLLKADQNGAVLVDGDPHPPAALQFTAGTLTSGTISTADLDSLASDKENSFRISFTGTGLDNDFTEISIGKGKAQGADLPAQLADIAERLQRAVHNAKPNLPAWRDFACTVSDSKLVLTSGVTGGKAIQVKPTGNAQANNIADALHLVEGKGAVPKDGGTPAGLGTGHGAKTGSEDQFDLNNDGLEVIFPSDPQRADEGIFALDRVDLFNLLCLPGVTNPAIFAKAIAYCIERDRRAFVIIDPPLDTSQDPPQSETPDNMVTFINGVNLPKGSSGERAALYYPLVKIPDPLNNGKLRSFGPSGTIAGLYARTDSSRGVWKAPAGTEAVLVGVQGLDRVLTDRENGILNPHGVNCLRIFPVFGAVCWGARTVSGDDEIASEYKYVPVRRTALYIEESLFRGLKWVVFEPNDEPLWAQIRLNVGAFMQNLFRQGAFQGQSPRDAYFVKCDKETTTQNDINLGIVNIVVGFAPLKPAEFVIIKLQQIAGQIQV